MNKIEKIIVNLKMDLWETIMDMDFLFWNVSPKLEKHIKNTLHYQLLNLRKSWIELKIKILESFLNVTSK